MSVTCLSGGATNLFAGTIGSGVFLTTNKGVTWTPVNSGLSSTIVWALAAAANGGAGTTLFVGTNDGAFSSTNNGASWTRVLTSATVRALLANGPNIFAGTEAGVYLSTDIGASWTPANAGLTSTAITALAAGPGEEGGSNVFVGTADHGVFLSTNNGTSWTPVNTGLTNPYVSALAVSPADSGTDRRLDSSGGTNVFAGTASPPGNPNGVFRSTNNGMSWTSVLISTDVGGFAVYGTNVFVGTEGGGVYLLTNNGTSWRRVNTGLTNLQIFDLIVGSDTSGTLYAGIGNGGGVWERPLSEMITSVQQAHPASPAGFALEQNYPNPFNPVTTIQFTLSFQERADQPAIGLAAVRSQHVTLKVYDVLGREVATLVNEEMKPGKYERTWDGSGMASGVYLCRLATGGSILTRKLMLVR